MTLSAEIVVRVQWSSGCSQIIHTSPSAPIDETLASHGFSAPPSHTVFVAFTGQFINPIISFHYYNISSGDKLACLAKKTSSNVCQVPHYLKQYSIARISDHQAYRMEKIREEARSKKRDQGFDRWELSGGFDAAMRKFVTEHEESKYEDYEDDSLPTVIPQVASMNEELMPTLWTISSPALTGTHA
jgi:hypothetical protein